MRIQKRSGVKAKGRACEAYPFADGNLKEMDEAAVKSLSGEGKAKMPATYGKTRWNGAKV